MKLMDVRVSGLNVWIEDKHILKGISFKAQPGTVTAIMGPSGSGKSTLIRVINRLIDLIPGARVEGEVWINNMNVLKEDPYNIRKYTGMVFQEPNPFPHMTIYENVAIGPKLHGLAKNKKELDEIVEWALKMAHLWDEVKDRLDDYPHQLSGGQRQRLSLARALALKPRVLLLDEPTANIDPVSTVKIEQSIVEYAKEEMATVIIVTHTPQQAARISDQILFLYEGRVIEYGPTKELVLRPRHELTKKFLGGEV
ncbi:phosphate import ATP-binding protein PstB [Aeropyrum pernix]|uniref:Phosphate import ATP-binding protein PstB n=1 Tax=Aeropyrum pernix TaxID=56636 RepID=A0A401HBV9_AERPX|nr:phosphate ABC transporter ATP-binding protein [Aeropyrum pernix]GBF09903.1 phosphate import ATP-binding protein PstB [Aeropyrum pernix]